MNKSIARTLVAVLVLLESVPRFGPRNRRLNIDSYQVAVEIRTQLRANGWDPHDPALQPDAN